MDNEREEEEMNLRRGLRASSIDSLEQTDLLSTPSESLRFINGHHKWVNIRDENRVDKTIDYDHQNTSQKDFMFTNDDHNSIQNTLSTNDIDIILKTHSENEEDEFNYENSLSHMDTSLNNFDVQHQNTADQMEHVFRDKKSSSILSSIYRAEKINRNPQTLEIEMDNGDTNSEKTNGYSQHRNNNNNNDGSYRRNRQTNGSSNNNNSDGGNGSNPNRNNNNSRRSDDDHSDGNDDDDDDDNDDDDADDEDNNDESDESIARRLGFNPIDDETILVISRLRNLTNKQSFDRRDFETLQSLTDELIRLQCLEKFPKVQLQAIVRYVKLYRPLQTKSRALIFLQERIPRRAVKYDIISASTENGYNVFDLWRERERRARLDSKDSLEDDANNSSGQKLRDVVEINHPTPPILLSTKSSSPTTVTKVKQMAKNIDTRSTSARTEINIRTGDRFSDHAYMPRSSSPTYPGLVSVALYDVKSTNKNTDGPINEVVTEDRVRSKPIVETTNTVSPTSSEPSRVRQMINRLESSSSSPSTNGKTTKKNSFKKSLHDENSDGSTSLTSSPPFKRFARRINNNEKSSLNGHNTSTDENFGFTQSDSNDEVFFQNKNRHVNDKPKETKFELKREENRTDSRRKISGTNMDESVSILLPGTETSVSMVRDIRARMYEDTSSVSKNDHETMPMKVDVETLYILEEKSEKKPSLTNGHTYKSDYDYGSRTSTMIERQDFGMQTITPTGTLRPMHRPVGTQVEKTVEHHTVSAQTTDSLHRPIKERQRLPSGTNQDDEAKKVTSTVTTTTRYEIKRRHSSHHASEEEDDGGAVIYIDDECKKSEYQDNFELKREKREKRDSSADDHLPVVPEKRTPFGQVTSRLRIDQLRDINRHVVRRHLQENNFDEEEYRSSEVYEIHTRGACKCVVVSSQENTQYGSETRFEKQLQRIERTYTEDELKKTELHVIVTTSDANYQLVKRDYGFTSSNINDKENANLRQPTISIHYYTKDGHPMKTEYGRRLEQLPLVLRCEIEYELNHYGSAQLIVLSVTNNERRQMNVSLKKEIVDEIVLRSNGRLLANSPELEKELNRQLAEPATLLHLVDYSSRDDFLQTNSSDLRRVSRIDVTTSLRLVQRFRTIIHRLCQQCRAHLNLSPANEKQRHLILVAQDEYYIIDLASQTPAQPVPSNISNIRQRQHDIFKREVSNVIQQQQQPFDYAKYRRDIEQQQRILEQQHQQKHKSQQTFTGPPPPGHPSEAEFYLGSQRRSHIEHEINSMRLSLRPHEHAPPCYQSEPLRRSMSICFSGAERYVRARIIHVKDFYDENQQRDKKQPKQTKEQELFVRLDDHINQTAANSLRRSYSSDYLQADGPRSRVRYIRIPGDAAKTDEKTNRSYKGVMYADLPYTLRYWNILYILDREARQGRPLGSTLPQVIVNDPYNAVIPPLTQHEIRQTARQILSPQYNGKSYTDQTLRWFLSRDKRTEIESAKYLHTIDEYRVQQQQQQQRQKRNSTCSTHGSQTLGQNNDLYATEKLIHYERLPDRLIPTPSTNRVQSTENLHYRSPSTPQILQAPHYIPRCQSQPQSHYQSSILSRGSNCPTPSHQQQNLSDQQRARLQSMQSPISRHQSVHELHGASAFSHPPSPSPSFHSLHSNQHSNSSYHTRRPISFNTRYTSQQQQQQQQQQRPILTEIIDSQTGRRILTTSQEQLPTEVLGLLNKYNLQQF